MDYWQGKYETLRTFYDEIVTALGFIAMDFGEPHEVHQEALARAKLYRRLIVDYQPDDEEDIDG